MSNFVIAAGHTASGNIGCGVVADLDESRCTREISQLVGKELEVRGHKANLLIIDKSNTYNCEDCYVRAQMASTLAQKEEVDLYVEIHINEGGGTGCEVLVTAILLQQINMLPRYVLHFRCFRNSKQGSQVTESYSTE